MFSDAPDGPPLGRVPPRGEAPGGRFGGIPPFGRIRWIGLAVLVVLAALLWLQPPFVVRQQQGWFDATQRILPRRANELPVTIVEVDQKSLAALGQWPWPRTVLAQLVREIQKEKPRAIGLDILMSETDRSSPEHWLDNMPTSDADLAQALESLPSHDEELARALGSIPVVLGMAGTPEPTGMLLFATPIFVAGAKDDAARIHDRIPRFAGVLSNLPIFEKVAAGHGMLSVEPEEGVVRRVPMVASVEGTLVPSFALELLRVSVGAPVLRLQAHDGRVTALAAGRFVTRTEGDGAIRIHYSPRDTRRFVPAIDVLQGRVEPERLAGKIVIVGVTGVVGVDYQETPLGDRMPGVEIHAQLIENLYEGAPVMRPPWARTLEVALFVLLGLALIYAAPVWRTPATVVFAVAAMIVPALASLAAFKFERLQFDAASPAFAMLALFAALLSLTLGESSRERRALRRQMQDEREASARMAGEMEAAQRIQVAMLPRDDAFRDDRRLDLATAMVPAREVGGDLYDFFRLDQRRLFFLVGDVSGKGLSASIFMAVSKALAKSAAVRHPDDDIGAWMTTVNREISRDNSESLFVTAFAGILDLDAGDLVYCNAGHDDPYCVGVASGLRRLGHGDGPPLCAVDDHEYAGEHTFLDRGEMIVLVTDGVTDMRDPSGAMYGRARLEALLERLREATLDAHATVNAIRDDVRAFAAGAEPADDFTILALAWRGR